MIRLRDLWWATAVVAAIGVLLAARSPSGPDDCSRPEKSRPLNLSRPADQQHLESDFLSIEHTAQRFRAYEATRPLESQSVDARAHFATRPERAYTYCVAVLTERLAEIHRLDPNLLAQLRLRSR